MDVVSNVNSANNELKASSDVAHNNKTQYDNFDLIQHHSVHVNNEQQFRHLNGRFLKSCGKTERLGPVKTRLNVSLSLFASSGTTTYFFY